MGQLEISTQDSRDFDDGVLFPPLPVARSPLENWRAHIRIFAIAVFHRQMPPTPTLPQVQPAKKVKRNQDKHHRENAPKRSATTPKNPCECGLDWCNADLNDGKLSISYKEGNEKQLKAFNMSMTRLGVPPAHRQTHLSARKMIFSR